MKRIALLIGIGLLGYLVFAIARFPATYAYDLVHTERMPWSMAALDGTVWQGRAGHAWMGNLHIDSMRWEIHPHDLILGRIESRFEATGPDLSARGTGGFTLFGLPYTRELVGQAPADRVAEQFELEAVRPSGVLEFQMEQLEFSRRHVESATGTVIWRNAGISRPTDIGLGDLRVDITTGEDGITFKVTDENAPVGIDIDLLICPDGAYELNGTITPSAAATPDLVANLSQLGQRDARGVIYLKYSGNLHR